MADSAGESPKGIHHHQGEREYKSLSPTDIKGYRLAGDGIYYVSRMFNDGERPELLFAEFLLQGGVSLYRYYHDDCNYFGFVDSDGREVVIRDDKRQTAGKASESAGGQCLDASGPHDSKPPVEDGPDKQ